MFATLDGSVDQARECRRESRRRELRSLCEQEARIKQRVTEIVREADDDGDWEAAGCSSSAQWLAQVSSSDYRSAVRITRTSSALRELPALDHAFSTGALTLDQVAAAAEFATPTSDAELARLAVGKPPSEVALAARTLAPPVVADDEALYERRSLRMSWMRGKRELAIERACPGFCVRRLGLDVDAVGVVDGEGGDGGGPVGAWSVPACGELADLEVHELTRGVLVGEVAADADRGA